jgi:hypothetical protein
MPYDYTVPNEANIVRTASGDLVKMRGNFVELTPLVSGVVLSGTAPSAAIRGLYLGDDTNRKRFFLESDGSDIFRMHRNINTEASPSWQPVLSFSQVSGATVDVGMNVSGISPVSGEHLATKSYVDSATLSGLTDTAVSGATSGQVLVYDGTDWTADALSLSRVICVLSGAQTQTIPQSTPTTFSGDEVPINLGGFTVSSGTITMPDTGVSLVDIQGEASWASSGAGTNYDLEIMLNGAALSGLTGYNLSARDRRRKSTTADICHQNVAALDVPVASGDTITMVVYQDGVGAGLDITGGTGLIVRRVA